MSKALDAMKKGDLVEFESDLQVESGPCTGVVLDVTERSVSLSYSDKQSRFFKRDLNLKRRTTAAKSGKTLWVFE